MNAHATACGVVGVHDIHRLLLYGKSESSTKSLTFKVSDSLGSRLYTIVSKFDQIAISWPNNSYIRYLKSHAWYAEPFTS